MINNFFSSKIGHKRHNVSLKKQILFKYYYLISRTMFWYDDGFDDEIVILHTDKNRKNIDILSDSKGFKSS